MPAQAGTASAAAAAPRFGRLVDAVKRGSGVTPTKWVLAHLAYPVVKALPDEFKAIRLTRDVYDAADRADAVVVTTEWPEFRLIEVDALRRVMRGDLVLDGRNCLPEASFVGSGLRLVGIGW